MAEWSLPRLDRPINTFNSLHYASYPSGQAYEPAPRVPRVSPSLPPQPQAQPFLPAPAPDMALHYAPQLHYGSAAAAPANGENPREVRNRAEKMRRDRLNQSVAELALMVPPVVAAKRKIDKTTVLRLTAHYLRAHQYVFGDSIGQSAQSFSPASILKVLSIFNGFLITVTYRGIIVVVSQNVNQYLGYTELDLLGQNLMTLTHEGDRAMLRDQLMPRTQTLGPNGELIIPGGPDGTRRVEQDLASETRRFVIRLKKLGQRSEPTQYIRCHVEGSFRKSDRACRGYNRCCQIVRRARARSENPCASGNDIVFIGIVRPTSETFINESALESYRMEYRTRHSIDGEIIQCEARIAIVTGYMTHEVSGVNAMNFMHRDDVRWVIIALREMYDEHRLFGESCYRLVTKNGQSIYMRTRGCLDVDRNTRAVTSFMCTNTMVDENEGKQLIKQMKRKFTLLVNNNEAPPIEAIEDNTHDEEQNEDQPAPVEDPRRLEQVILHLVTNLPSPSPQESEEEPFTAASPERNRMSPHRLAIIPPNKERIVSAIEKIYSVINIIQRDSNHENIYEQSSSTAGSSHTTPQYMPPVDMNINRLPDHINSFEDHMNRFPDHINSFEDHMNRFPDQTNSFSEHLNSCPDLMNSFPTPQMQESQIVPYQNIHVPNYQQADDNSLVQQLSDIDNYNVSDIDFNTDDILNAVASPDMGNFDASEDPFTDLSSLFENLQNGEEMFSDQQIEQVQEFEYHGAESETTMPMPQYAEESNQLQALPQASTSSNYSCGTKRPSDSDGCDTACKRKITKPEFVCEEQFVQEAVFISELQFDPAGDLAPEAQFAPEAEYIHEAEFALEAELFRDAETVRVAETVREIEQPEESESPLDISLDESHYNGSVQNRARESQPGRTRDIPAGRT